MKILLLTHNFSPDLGAASFRMDSLVRELSKNNNVYIITAYPNRYNDLNIKILDDFNEKVKIIRVKNIKQSNNLVKRSFSYIEYFFKSYFIAKKFVKKCDVVVATSPQILTGYLGSIISTKVPFILDVRDLWPESMLDLGITSSKSLIYKILKKIEIKMYKKSTHIVINSPAFKDSIEKYIDKEISLVTNGLDDYIYDYFSNKSVVYNKRDKIKIVYAGNLGIAQDIEILAKIRYDVSKFFIFYLIGNGTQKGNIENIIKEKNIDNIKIFNSKERSELLKEYDDADGFFVHLKNIPMFEKTIPSKIFEYVATKKPVVYGLNGVSKRIMDNLNAGFSFSAGDIESLEIALLKLKDSLENSEWKYNENLMLKNEYLRSNLSKNFVSIIEDTYEKYYKKI